MGVGGAPVTIVGAVGAGGVPVGLNGFDLSVQPTVTAGAYSAGDIMGGLMTFAVGSANQVISLEAVQLAFKSAVTPSLTLLVFNADPTGTTKTDNAVYSLATTDVFNLRAALPLNSLGAYQVDHGTPNTFHLGNLDLPIKSLDGNLYVLLIDNTGVTLASTSDLQVTLQGKGA